MSLDEALLCACATAAPVLRFYRWARPAVSLGYRQSAPAWLARAEPLGVDTVRRATGGGTVVHVGDLTYSVIVPALQTDRAAATRAAFSVVATVTFNRSWYSFLRSLFVFACWIPIARRFARRV